jgi:NAD kinase
VIVCILRGPGAEQSVVDRAIAALKERGVEAVETDRDGPTNTVTEGLKGCGLVVTLGGDGTFLAGAR